MTELPSKQLMTVLVMVGQESDALQELHEDICVNLKDREVEFIYLVSAVADESLETALQLFEGDPGRIRVLRFAEAIGPASMLKAGLEAAGGELILTLPGEFDVDLSEIDRLCDAIDGGADLAIASRSDWNDAAVRIQSRIFSHLLSRAAGSRFGDVTSRTRLLRKCVAPELAIYGEFHRYLPMLAHQAGFSVSEIPFRQHPRARAARAFAPSAYFWRVLDLLSIFFLSRFTRHPLRLFGGVGGALGLVGAVIFLTLGAQRLLFDVPVADRPILVLGALLIGLGVQIFTIGLLGELILYVHGRSVRDYRIAKIYESPKPQLSPSE